MEKNKNQIKDSLGISLPFDSLQMIRVTNQSFLENKISNEELDILGIEGSPEDAPEYDRLACWQDKWTEKNLDVDKIEQQRLTLKNKTCDFYFPYRQKGNMTFEACEKQRQENIEKSRFVQSVILYPIVTGLIVWAITYFFVK